MSYSFRYCLNVGTERGRYGDPVELNFIYGYGKPSQFVTDCFLQFILKKCPDELLVFYCQCCLVYIHGCRNESVPGLKSKSDSTRKSTQPERHLDFLKCCCKVGLQQECNMPFSFTVVYNKS